MTYTTKADYVYKALIQDITEGKYNGGERIVVSAVSQKYGISPIPVREAIQRLAQDGYVEIEPHVGARVVHMDYGHLWEIMLLREQIEPLTAKLAVRDIGPEDIAYLDELNRQMETSLEESDPDAYEKLNREFHQFVYNKCRYKTIRDLTNTLWQQSALSRTVLLDGKINAASHQDHIEWVEKIKERDEDAVFKIVQRHKERAFKRFQEKYGIKDESAQSESVKAAM